MVLQQKNMSKRFVLTQAHMSSFSIMRNVSLIQMQIICLVYRTSIRRAWGLTRMSTIWIQFVPSLEPLVAYRPIYQAPLEWLLHCFFCAVHVLATWQNGSVSEWNRAAARSGVYCYTCLIWIQRSFSDVWLSIVGPIELNWYTRINYKTIDSIYRTWSSEIYKGASLMWTA